MIYYDLYLRKIYNIIDHIIIEFCCDDKETSISFVLFTECDFLLIIKIF